MEFAAKLRCKYKNNPQCNHVLLLPNSTVEECINMYTVMKEIVNVIMKFCCQVLLLKSVYEYIYTVKKEIVNVIMKFYSQAPLLKSV